MHKTAVLLHRVAGRAAGGLVERATGIGASYDLGTIERVGGDFSSCPPEVAVTATDSSIATLDVNAPRPSRKISGTLLQLASP
jgi:hypothetical protein